MNHSNSYSMRLCFKKIFLLNRLSLIGQMVQNILHTANCSSVTVKVNECEVLRNI